MNFDSWLLAKVEKLSHFIQRQTGWNCLTQARICLGSSVPIILLCSSVLLLSGHYIMGPLTFACLLNMVVVVIPSLQHIEKGLSPGTQNAWKIHPIHVFLRSVVRAVLSVFIFLGCVAFPYLIRDNRIIFLAVAAALIAWAAAIYLSACTPLPPGNGRIRDWIRSLSSGKALPQGV